MMEETLSRSERTRRSILKAAADSLREKGTGAAIDAIAEAAGVSKGGLLYHFPSRDDLMLAVARDSLQQLRAHVASMVDFSENHPGKVLRAYIRALFAGADEVRAHFDYPGLWGTLCVMPGVPEVLREDAEYWHERFTEDSLHPDRIFLARNAAEGFASSRSWDTPADHATLRHAQDLILSITDSSGPLDA